MAKSAIENQRAELARLYIAVIDADGMPAVHRLLSAALIAHRRTKAKGKKPPKRDRAMAKPRAKPLSTATAIEWHGEKLVLGDAMRRCNERQQKFVLFIVRDGLSIRAAERVVGYSSGGANGSAFVKAAIAEERARL